MSRAFVDLNNARTGEYKNVIGEILKTGKCPFCPEYFRYHKKPILKGKGGWFVTENTWPYKNTSSHLLIIGKTHKENLFELAHKDLKNIFDLANWAIKKYKVKGGAIVARFGNTRFTGASVVHLHFHIVSPKPTKKQGSKRVLFPIGGT